MSGGFCDRLEETNIKKLVIVECHGVTKTERAIPYNPANEVIVEYPTILTAHLGTQTTVCGDLFQQASRICEIVTGHINTYEDKTFEDGISVAELVRVLKRKVVDNDDGNIALLKRKTPIKPKLPQDSFQNIELFCPGVRLESGPGKYPVGNTDGVWVCDLIGADDENAFGSKNITKDLFTDHLQYDPTSRKVLKDHLEYNQKLKQYSTKNHTWLTKDGGIVTYRELIESLKENPTEFPPESTAIMLATCRGFEDDPDDRDGDEVPSKPGEAPSKPPKKGRTLTDAEMVEMQQLLQRQEEITRQRQILQQKHQQWLLQQEQLQPRQQQHNLSQQPLQGGSKRNARKRGRSNKKRRYTKRKKYFKSSRKVNTLKIKKRRTRKYKNKK